MKKIPTTKKQFKQEARDVGYRHNLKPTHAHEVLARYYGFKTYNAFLASLKD